MKNLIAETKLDTTKIVPTQFVTKCYDTYLTGFHLKKNFRSYKHYHPSELGGCIRKAVAMYLNWPGDFYTHGRAQRTFANGHKTHERLQDDMGDMGILLGRWRCIKCDGVMGKEEKHGIKKPTDCEFCHNPKMTREVIDDEGNVQMPPRAIFEYREIPVFHKRLNISGHCDGIIEVNGLKFIIDYKTISMSQFEVITDDGIPHEKYVSQINLYMDMLEVPLGLIYYENSNTKLTAEYFCKQDAPLVEGLYAKVEYGDEYAQRGQLPPIPPKLALNPANNECMGFPGYPPCPLLRTCFPKEFEKANWSEKFKKFVKM